MITFTSNCKLASRKIACSVFLIFEYFLMNSYLSLDTRWKCNHLLRVPCFYFILWPLLCLLVCAQNKTRNRINIYKPPVYSLTLLVRYIVGGDNGFNHSIKWSFRIFYRFYYLYSLEPSISSCCQELDLLLVSSYN